MGQKLNRKSVLAESAEDTEGKERGLGMSPKTQKEITQITLNDSSDLVATIVGNEKLILRVFLNTDSYQGPTERGVRFYLFDGIWEEFKKLVDKVDEEVKS